MNIEIQQPRHHPFVQLFDWQTEVERLERDATLAEEAGYPTDLALIDAECSLDLIDTDLSAARQVDSDPETVIRAIQRLSEWRGRIACVIERLRGQELPE